MNRTDSVGRITQRAVTADRVITERGDMSRSTVR